MIVILPYHNRLQTWGEIMSREIVIQNCTVEFVWPEAQLDECNINRPMSPKVRITAGECVEGLTVRSPDGKVVTFCKLMLQITGNAVPVYDEVEKMFRWYTIEDDPKPTVVGVGHLASSTPS